MPPLSTRDYRSVLELVAVALRCASPDFPDTTVTCYLRDLFQAEFAVAGQIDFRGTAGRMWANSPGPIPVSPDGFHQYVVRHLLAGAYQQTNEPVPLRLRDVTCAPYTPPGCGGATMSRMLIIPLLIVPECQCVIALLRSGPDFTPRELELAYQLQPILGGIYAFRDRLTRHPHDVPGTGTGIPITARELAVLDLLADGQIAASIARRLGISPHTVGKHIQNIYRKLGAHDRVSAVLRAQALGILPRAECRAAPVPELRPVFSIRGRADRHTLARRPSSAKAAAGEIAARPRSRRARPGRAVPARPAVR